MVTIHDVAKETKVSDSTVSIVLGKRATPLPISQKTRDKVLAAAARLGYRRNALAVQMQTGMTGFFSFLAHEVSQEYIFKIFVGAMKEVINHNYTLKMHELPFAHDKSDIEKEAILRYYDNLLESRPESILIGSFIPHQEYLIIAAHQLGILVGCADCKENSGFDVAIFSDAYRGESEATEYLYQLGHRKIGFISDDTSHQYVRPRMSGFMDTLKKHQIVLPSEWNLNANYRDSNLIYEYLKNLLHSGSMPTAVCCSSDYIALQVIISAHLLGLRVPEDLSVIGFGAIEALMFIRPSISTVSQHYDEMGRVLTNRIIQHIRDRTIPPEIITQPVSILKRESTAKCKTQESKNDRKK